MRERGPKAERIWGNTYNKYINQSKLSINKTNVLKESKTERTSLLDKKKRKILNSVFHLQVITVKVWL